MTSRDKFDVKMTADSFVIDFSGFSYTKKPTVVAFPNWFSFGEQVSSRDNSAESALSFQEKTTHRSNMS